MGALHEGHIRLLEVARERCPFVTLSIFVNPLQFGPHEDLSRYPRPLERDLEIAERAGVAQVFVPSVEEMYPSEPTTVHVPGVTERWEGERRPGHFDGVATVVARLFGIVGAGRAFFGWKDLQQCLTIAKMTRDLALPVTLDFIETVREGDGLARSSRNAYLSPEERAKAPELYAALRASESAIREARSVGETLERQRESLMSRGFDVDYLAYVDLDAMAPLTRYQSDSALVVAARIGTTRLIDNIRLGV